MFIWLEHVARRVCMNGVQSKKRCHFYVTVRYILGVERVPRERLACLAPQDDQELVASGGGEMFCSSPLSLCVCAWRKL